MKNWFLSIFILLVIPLQALPVGNPEEASLFYTPNENCQNTLYDFLSLRAGYYGDYVFNHHLETINRKKIDTTQIFTNAAYFAINYCDCFDLFSTLGASRLSLNTSLGAFNSVDPHPLFEVESRSAFSYSFGARATLWNYRCLALGVVGQYFSTSPSIKRLYIAAGAVSYPDKELQTHFREWQLAAGLSYRLHPFFIPYAALKYAQSRWKLSDGRRFVIEQNMDTFLYNLRNPRHWGYAFGLTFNPRNCNVFAVTVEARFLHEKGIYVNGQMKF